ncbi:hypothetical protein EUTSA_v10029234mg, partial [Eutrema salsugineum]
FHIAASMNQTEVMKLLRKTVKVKAKNLDGKTAMDILQTHQSPCFLKARRLLQNAKEILLGRSTTTLAGYLSKNLTFIERRNNLLGLSNLSMTGDMSLNTSNSYDEIILVAVLIATATYQAGLSPHGGFWQENSNHGDENFHFVGEMTMEFNIALFFLALNGFAFLSSLYVIIILIVGLPMWKFMYGSTATLGVAMLFSYTTIFPIPPHSQFGMISKYVFVFAFPLIIGIMLLATFMAFIVDKRRRHRVDFPASCF